jgi:hypothetical protein
MSFGWMDGRDGMGGGDLTGWGWTGGMNGGPGGDERRWDE